MLLMTRVKNQVSKIAKGNYEYHLRNISVNGSKRGCYGFIVNKDNGVVVYINTEKSCYVPLSTKNLVRYARDIKDFGGSHSLNEWATDEDVFSYIVQMLSNKNRYMNFVNRKI